MSNHKTINGIKFKTGKGSQQRQFDYADKNNHKAIIAMDYFYGDNNISKGYASFDSWDDFLDKFYYPRHKDKWYAYELIREGTPCKIHFDLDWNIDSSPEQDVRQNVKEFIITIWHKEFGEDLRDCDILTLRATSGHRGSLHLVILGYYVQDNERLKKWILEMQNKYGNDITRAAIDWKIYTKNRLMRLPYSKKLGGSTGMFVPEDPCEIECLMITYLSGQEKLLDLK